MKFAMVGVQFQEVGDAGEISVNDFIKGDFAAVDFDENDEFLETAPQIQAWNGGAYTLYYYLNAHDGQPAGWCDDWGDYSEDTFTPGQAVWFWAKTGACTITTPGQVATEDDVEITCPAGKFSMVANFMPVPLDLNNADQVSYDGLVGVDFDANDEFLETAPQVQNWNGGAYTLYYYLNEHDGIATGWCDDWGDVPEDTIPAGRGFWVKANTGTFKFMFTK